MRKQLLAKNIKRTPDNLLIRSAGSACHLVHKGFERHVCVLDAPDNPPSTCIVAIQLQFCGIVVNGLVALFKENGEQRQGLAEFLELLLIEPLAVAIDCYTKAIKNLIVIIVIENDEPMAAAFPFSQEKEDGCFVALEKRAG